MEFKKILDFRTKVVQWERQIIITYLHFHDFLRKISSLYDTVAIVPIKLITYFYLNFLVLYNKLLH